MTSSLMRAVGGALCSAALISGVAAAQNGPSTTAGGGLIHIEYEAPKNPAHQEVLDAMRQRRALETIKDLLSPLRLPVDLHIKTVGCDGVPNAWYERDSGIPTVRICYEYLQEIWDGLPRQTTPTGLTPHDALIGQFLFAALHESGHAVYDIFDVPIFGHQEDAADNFAAYKMLHMFADQPHRLIQGAAYSYRGVIEAHKSNPQVTLPLKVFSSVHGTPEQRYYNLLCMAYGYDAKEFAAVVDKHLLPESRAQDCPYEYHDMAYAFHKMIAPHMDMELAKIVLHTRWFADADLPPPPPRREAVQQDRE
jgi:Putative metallopeptidase